MSSRCFKPNKRHLRELLIYFFNLKKSVEAHRLLVEAYGDAALRERSRECFQKFKNDERLTSKTKNVAEGQKCTKTRN